MLRHIFENTLRQTCACSQRHNYVVCYDTLFAAFCRTNANEDGTPKESSIRQWLHFNRTTCQPHVAFRNEHCYVPLFKKQDLLRMMRTMRMSYLSN